MREGARLGEMGAESGVLCSRLLLLSHPRQGFNTERQLLTAPNLDEVYRSHLLPVRLPLSLFQSPACEIDEAI